VAADAQFQQTISAAIRSGVGEGGERLAGERVRGSLDAWSVDFRVYAIMPAMNGVLLPQQVAAGGDLRTVT
jgi:hypothetical protein